MNQLDASLLSDVPPFRRLDTAQVRAILDLATPRRFDPGQTVFQEGSNAREFYLLLDGVIRVQRTTPGGDQIIALHISAGQLFGIANALGRKTYPATAEAAAECLTLGWPGHLWDDFAKSYDGFATETYRVVGERLGEMNNRIVEMATQAVEQRIACALLRLVTQTGKKTDAGIEITFPITRANIADMTGTTLHTVSRLLSAWEKQGIIASTRKHIVVIQPHQLVLLSGTSG